MGVLQAFAIGMVCVSSTLAGARLVLGTPASILRGLETENTEVSRSFTFITSSAEKLPVRVEDYYFRNGELSMAGRARESAHSDFILKGDAASVYGWVVLKDRNLAYEYTTSPSGAVMVEEVPVERIYPVCELEGGEEAGLPGPAPVGEKNAPEDHIKAYAGQDLFKLQSLPGARKVLWLDIRDVMNGDTPILFSKEEMYKTWQVFASSFSMFEVNVTTDKAVYDAAGVTNSGINKLMNVRGRSFCPINAFGTTRFCQTQTQAEPMTHYQYGKTAAHETGHLMGLRHDGNASTQYFGGFSTYQWSTIMGNNLCCRTWTQPAIQWSKGEYTGSNNDQDDLAIIARNLPLRADDISAAVPLRFTRDTVDPLLNRGQINSNSDVDLFSFSLASPGGRVILRIDRTEIRGGSALDIHARILNGAGNTVAQQNPTAVRSASFDQQLPAGNYTLAIAGGAEGTPQNGFSNYASLGFYAVSGRLPGGTPVSVAPVAARPEFLISPRQGNGRLDLRLPPQAKVERIALYSSQGARLFQSLGRVESIDMTRQAVGTYWLNLTLDGQTFRTRVLRR